VCGVQWPVRFAEHFPRQQHHVSLSVADDVVRLFRFGDETDGAGRDPGLFPNAFRERYLKPGTNRNLRVRHQAARRAIDEIDAFVFQLLHQRHGLIGIPTALGPIGRGDADKERRGIPNAANRANNLQQQTNAVFE